MKLCSFDFSPTVRWKLNVNKDKVSLRIDKFDRSSIIWKYL